MMMTLMMLKNQLRPKSMQHPRENGDLVQTNSINPRLRGDAWLEN